MELEDEDGLGLAGLVRQGEVSPLELIDDAIMRCERVNGTLNAVVTEMFDHARARAAQPLGDGPFAGVPFLMKDFGAEVAGVRFTEGTRFLANHVSEQDSELYQRFCRAGLVTIGKSNLPELAVGTTTEPRLFGACRNPWDPRRTTGGSSGGAGAAVAARVVPLAHANDIGGSIRIPAACCALVGLKPSRGRVSLAPHYGDVLAGFFQELALTRSVRDTATLLDVVAGPAPGEPYVAPAPTASFASALESPGPRRRIAFSTETPLGDPLDAVCVQAIQSTARLCEELGHEVLEARPTFDAELVWSSFTVLLGATVGWAIGDWERRTGRTATEAQFEPFVWAFRERGRGISAPDYLLAMQDIQREARAIATFYERHDVLLTTTLGQPPVELGTLRYEGDPIALRRRMARFSPFTFVANATGQPAISLPLHWTDDGLPVGLHFTARYGEERLLLELAGELEQARPWSTRKPMVCAE